ncbi:MAG: hypothetical protein NTV68_13615 [Methanomicrobiales archaeon]|nr:hypothetical protein [Methanomicrobiales archaeon]
MQPILATTAVVNQPARMKGRPFIVEHETVIKNVAIRPDSFELGTPVKSGCIKIYFDVSDVADAELRIRNVIALRDLANTLTSYPTPIAQAGKVHA